MAARATPDNHPTLLTIGRRERSAGPPSSPAPHFVDALGFEPTADIPFGERERWVEVTPPGGGTALALVPPRGDYKAGCMTGIALDTTDAQGAREELQAKGIDGSSLKPKRGKRIGSPHAPALWLGKAECLGVGGCEDQPVHAGRASDSRPSASAPLDRIRLHAPCSSDPASFSYPLELHFLRGDALHIPRQAQLLHRPNEPPRWIDLPRLQSMLG
jgi:hypothetical protein